MKRIRKASLSFNALIAIALSLAFITYPGQRISTATARATVTLTAGPPTLNDLKLRSEARLKAEANLYDTAMREIGRITSMRLTTAAELERANAIVGKHITNLKYNRSKLISLGFSDATFSGGIRAKARDKKAEVEMAMELAKDPTAIFRVSGGQALGDRIRRTLNADVAKIQQVSAQLKKASADIKANIKSHHAAGLENSLLSDDRTNLQIAIVVVALIVIVAAVILYPPLGAALVAVATKTATDYAAVVVPALVVAAAATLIGNLFENAATEEGRDRVQECHDRADRRYRRCMRDAADAGFFKGPAEAACYAEWLVASGTCWVS